MNELVYLLLGAVSMMCYYYRQERDTYRDAFAEVEFQLQLLKSAQASEHFVSAEDLGWDDE